MRFTISVLLAFLSLASAEPLKRTLNDAVFIDATEATGSFEFDDDADKVTNIDITTQTGGGLEGKTYTQLLYNIGNQYLYFLEDGADPAGDLNGKQRLEFIAVAPFLTNDSGQGGCFVREVKCADSNCQSDSANRQTPGPGPTVESSTDLDATCSGETCGLIGILSQHRMHRMVGSSCVSKCVLDQAIGFKKERTGWSCGECPKRI
jgi:hypothetical protein